MAIHFLTYCTPNFLRPAQTLIKSAKKFGLKNIHFYQRHDLEKTKFYQENKHILDLPQRAGCSQWKIYYMHHVYSQMQEGDILFYVDAGADIIANPQPLFDIAEKENLCLFNINNNPKNKEWTKRDAFVYMDCDIEEYYEAYQTNAFCQLYKKTPFCDKFLNEMFQFAQDIRIIADLENVSGKPNLEGFVEHRFDQSILGLLAQKYKVETHRYPTQWGNHQKLEKHRVKGEWLAQPYSKQPMLNSNYPTIFNHHRNYSLVKDMQTKKFWLAKYYHTKHELKMALLKANLLKK